MDYQQLIISAKKAGITDEHKMWKSIENVGELLECMKEEHPKEYCNFMREQHSLFYGCHYTEEIAKHDVDLLKYTDAAGNKKSGAHWTPEQIKSATASMNFPQGTTLWDAYVAMNASYADFCKHFDEEQILQMGYDFYFNDEDWNGEGKIWHYMSMNLC